MSQISKPRKLVGILFTATCIVSSNAIAQDSDPSKSMLYLQPEPDTSDLTTLPASQRPVDQGDRCIQLMKEADALKGKPQRRSAAMARYEAECQR
jgi:hypothetical protein